MFIWKIIRVTCIHLIPLKLCVIYIWLGTWKSWNIALGKYYIPDSGIMDEDYYFHILVFHVLAYIECTYQYTGWPNEIEANLRMI